MNFDLEIFEKEIKEDCFLDEINIKDKQLMLPAIKHKWAFRLIKAKQSHYRLKENQKEETKKEVDELLNGKLKDVLVSNSELNKIKNKIDKKTNSEIRHLELVIEYLENVSKILNSMTYDIKGAIDLIKLETL